MTSYQTTIQKPDALRWGSAKIELKAESGEYINLGAIKGVSATFETTGVQSFEPDNAPPIKTDPVPRSWNWTFTLEEAWDEETIKLMRGDIDTHTTTGGETVIGVYAGAGSRPYLGMRITNTTPGARAAVIELPKAKVTSELDWTFPADTDKTTTISLSVTLSAEWTEESGFGTITLKDAA